MVPVREAKPCPIAAPGNACLPFDPVDSHDLYRRADGHDRAAVRRGRGPNRPANQALGRECQEFLSLWTETGARSPADGKMSDLDRPCRVPKPHAVRRGRRKQAPVRSEVSAVDEAFRPRRSVADQTVMQRPALTAVGKSPEAGGRGIRYGVCTEPIFGR